MSRERRVYRFSYYSFPRVSGDEPTQGKMPTHNTLFSPREWG